VGLVVRGEVEVRQAGERVADLGTGSVFGAVACLYSTRRNASRVARSEVLLWRWEPEWLQMEADRIELRPELEAPAEARGAGR
jgi:hypothetical protein